jgi:phosphate transport system permease protein
MSQTGTLGDKIFQTVLLLMAAIILVVVAAIIGKMILNSWPTLEQYGPAFLTGREWVPAQNKFGALPFIYGTIVSSLVALIISVPLSLGIAIFLVEQAPKKIATPIGFMVELLAAIPSVV